MSNRIAGWITLRVARVRTSVKASTPIGMAIVVMLVLPVLLEIWESVIPRKNAKVPASIGITVPVPLERAAARQIRQPVRTGRIVLTMAGNGIPLDIASSFRLNI